MLFLLLTHRSPTGFLSAFEGQAVRAEGGDQAGEPALRQPLASFAVLLANIGTISAIRYFRRQVGRERRSPSPSPSPSSSHGPGVASGPVGLEFLNTPCYEP